VYGLITGLRNLLYDRSLLNSYHPDIPVIVVGNLIAGGTGKTPMVAWIARELSEKYRVAVLSRGYGRRTRGFLLLDEGSTPETVGDEPMELRLLLPGIHLAVDKNRKRGIQNLTSGKYGKTDLILMDDGFQHRRVTPGYSIILDDFNRPVRSEKLLPAGLRREPLSALKRADLIIETKKQISFDSGQTSSRIILITGIANSQRLADEISKSGLLLHHLKFPDHHRYKRADAEWIRKTYKSSLNPQGQDPALLLTTGKDFVKLSRMPELSDLPLLWIPTGPPINPDQKREILYKIYQYVEKTYGSR
jgi:tetraacyldisaccharide 4'-kinase